MGYGRGWFFLPVFHLCVSCYCHVTSDMGVLLCKSFVSEMEMGTSKKVDEMHCHEVLDVPLCSLWSLVLRILAYSRVLCPRDALCSRLCPLCVYRYVYCVIECELS